jgi:hypothetical protein
VPGDGRGDGISDGIGCRITLTSPYSGVNRERDVRLKCLSIMVRDGWAELRSSR